MTISQIILAGLAATLVCLIIFRPWPHEGEQVRLASEVGAGGSSTEEEVATNSLSAGLTATAGADDFWAREAAHLDEIRTGA